jgi:adenine-specific DNA-methyltransferase
MELVFKDKLDKNQILSLASKQGSLSNEVLGKSFIMQGDNFIGLSKLLNTQKGFIDLVYIDPPFNTNQIFSVSQNRASTISRAKSSITAYEDLMDTDEFLNFMYKRFVLLYELLSENGSLYVHIDTKMGHYFKVILDEIFGRQNYKNDITRIKSNPKNFDRKAYGNEKDMILFYSKNSNKNIWNEIRIELSNEELQSKFTKIDEEEIKDILHLSLENNKTITELE